MKNARDRSTEKRKPLRTNSEQKKRDQCPAEQGSADVDSAL